MSTSHPLPPWIAKRLTMVPRKGSQYPCEVVSEKNGSVRILIPDRSSFTQTTLNADSGLLFMFLYAFVILVIPWKGELSNGFWASFQLCQIWSGGDPSCFNFIHGNEHLSTVWDELATKISRLKVSCVQESGYIHVFLSKNFNLFFVELKTPTNSVCRQLSTIHWSDASTPIQFKSNFVVVNHFVLGITYFAIFHQTELFGHSGVDLVLHSNSSGFNMGPRLDMKSLRMGNISNFWDWAPNVLLCLPNIPYPAHSKKQLA